MRTALRLVLVLVIVIVVGGATALAGAASGASCPTGWGSLPRTAAGQGSSALTAVTTGRHPCFDRVVVRVAGPASGHTVRYVGTVVADGSGKPLSVPGGARLELRLRHPAYDSAGRPTVPATFAKPVADVRGYDTLQAVVWGGSFEGVTTLGVGTRARLPFRVTVLPGPGRDSRIVLDVAHRW
jgi:hypothetical protein